MEIVKGRGLLLSKDDYYEILSHHNGHALWKDQYLILNPEFSNLYEFLPQIEDEGDSWRISLSRNGKEVVSCSKPVSPNHIPVKQIAKLEAALEKLKQRFDRPEVDIDKKNALHGLSFPNPVTSAGFYRIYGPPWAKKLIVIWGFQPRRGIGSGGFSTLAPIALDEIKRSQEQQFPFWLKWLALGAFLLALILFGLDSCSKLDDFLQEANDNPAPSAGALICRPNDRRLECQSKSCQSGLSMAECTSGSDSNRHPSPIDSRGATDNRRGPGPANSNGNLGAEDNRGGPGPANNSGDSGAEDNRSGPGSANNSGDSGADDNRSGPGPVNNGGDSGATGNRGGQGLANSGGDTGVKDNSNGYVPIDNSGNPDATDNKESLGDTDNRDETKTSDEKNLSIKIDIVKRRSMWHRDGRFYIELDVITFDSIDLKNVKWILLGENSESDIQLSGQQKRAEALLPVREAPYRIRYSANNGEVEKDLIISLKVDTEIQTDR